MDHMPIWKSCNRLNVNQAENEKGFSLIEIMISLSIFAVGILAISSLQIGTINSNAKAGRTVEAVAIAQEQVETLMTSHYADVNTTGPITLNTRYNVSWTVAAPVMNTKDVALIVSWREGTQTRSIAMNFTIRDETI